MSEDFEGVTLEATVDSPKLDEMAFELIKIGWEKHNWHRSVIFNAPSSFDATQLAEAAARQIMIMYRELAAAIDQDMEDDEEEA